MPPQETKILSDFLLAPAPLRDFITLQQFTSIFGSKQRSNPAIPELYRELHRLREEDIDRVRQDISEEVKRSRQIRRQCGKQRRLEDMAMVPGVDPEMLQMEEEILGQRKKKLPTLDSVHRSIEEACNDLETQNAELREENRRALEEVQEYVSALSDLRHGKFAQNASGEDMTEELLASLKQLEAACATAPSG